MSLSDDERVRYMYQSISAIMDVRRDWIADEAIPDYQRKKHQHLFDALGGMWHAFLGGQSNGMHWILASSATSTIHTDIPRSPWEMAITGTLEQAAPKSKNEFVPSGTNPFDGRDMANIPAFLKIDGDESTAHVFRAYMLIEGLVYPLRRYDDAFLRKYNDLSRLVSDFMGDAYVVFCCESVAKAYVLFEILKLLYGPLYPYHKGRGDVVADFAGLDCLHGCIGKAMKREMSDLVKWHVGLVRDIAAAKALGVHAQHEAHLTMRVRLWAFLEFHTGLYEYAHTRKAFIAAVRKSCLRRCVPELIASMDAKAIVYKAIVYKASVASAVAKENASSGSSALNAYGFAGYRLMSGNADDE